MPRVSIVTGYRPGGPYYWAEKLVAKINGGDSGWTADHPGSFLGAVVSPLYLRGDVVHTTLPLAYHLWRKPIVLTVKGNYLIENVPGGKLFPKIVEEADVVTAPSHFIKNKLGLSRAIVIPNGVKIPAQKAQPFRDPNIVRALTVTKFWFKDKATGIINLYSVLQAANKVSRKKIVWDILGGGEYLNEIKQSVKSTETITINFHGFTDPQPFYQRADLFIYWSDLDNMPNVLLEAAAYGMPTLTNNVGAVNEIINDGETGYICGSPNQYIERLSQMLSNPERAKDLGEKARVHMEKSFDNDKIVGEYLKIYNQLLEKHGQSTNK